MAPPTAVIEKNGANRARVCAWPLWRWAFAKAVAARIGPHALVGQLRRLNFLLFEVQVYGRVIHGNPAFCG
jgi:hypothetical protein